MSEDVAILEKKLAAEKTILQDKINSEKQSSMQEIVNSIDNPKVKRLVGGLLFLSYDARQEVYRAMDKIELFEKEGA